MTEARERKKDLLIPLPPGQELQPNRGMMLSLDTIYSDLDDFATGGPTGQELQADRGMTSKLETIQSDFNDIAAALIASEIASRR
jgi:hypothetical protein